MVVSCWTYLAFAIHVSTEPYKQTIPSDVVLTLTSVVLEKAHNDKPITFFVHQDDVAYPICHFTKNGIQEHRFQLTIASDQEFECSVGGSGLVTVLGYFQEAPVASFLEDFADASDFEEEDEDSSEMASESAPPPPKQKTNKKH